MLSNNISHEQNFSIPMTPIDNNNFSDFFDSNDFLFSENHIKTDEIFENKPSIFHDEEAQTSLLTFCNQVFLIKENIRKN